MKNIYQNRLKFFYFFHVLTLLITGVVTTVVLFQTYKYGEPKDDIFSKYRKFESKTPILKSYFRYTGTETGFGFFAPNVKSHDILFFESCNELFDLKYDSYEGTIRNNSMISSTIGYVLDEIKGKEDSESLRLRYSDLLLQNLVSKVRQANELPTHCNEVKVTYKILEYPPLKSQFNKEPELITLKNWYYETK